MLDKLPLEILILISSYCAQADVVSLAISLPLISDTIVKDIYRCIIVDPVPRKLQGNRATKLALTDGKQEKLVPATTVTTLAGIRRLLTTLASSPKIASMVRSFTVRGNIAMSDNVLIPKVQAAVQHLTFLQEFEWTACPELPPQVLLELHSVAESELLSLKIDLAARPNHMLPLVKFPNLRTLHARPFLTIENLKWLREMVSESQDLENLELSRYLDAKREVGSSFTFLGMSDVNTQSNSIAAIATFFNTSHWRFRTLNLIQIDSSSADLEALQNADISQLEELQLVGTGRECENDHQILTYITHKQPQLEKVQLNWIASVLATTRFLSKCCSRATALKLTIKTSPNLIIRHLVDTCTQLTHVEIDIECDYSRCDLEPLQKLTSLTFLRIPFSPTVTSWEIVSELPALKVIKLVNTTTSQQSSVASSYGARPMGLLTNGIMGSWNDHLHSPFKCANIVAAARSNPSLEYVVVDDHVTNLKLHARPLDEYCW